MSGVRWPALLAVAVLLTGAASANFGNPDVYPADQITHHHRESFLSRRFDLRRLEVRVPVLPPALDVLAQLYAMDSQVISCAYVNRVGHRIMLSMAYGGDQLDSNSSPRPAIWNPSQAFEIAASMKAALPAANVNRVDCKLMSVMGGCNELIPHWVMVGNALITPQVAQKPDQLLHGVCRVTPDAKLPGVASIQPDMFAGHAVRSDIVVVTTVASVANAGQARTHGFSNLAL